MADKDIRTAADGLAGAIVARGHDEISTLGHDLKDTVSRIEHTATRALAKGTKAARKESRRLLNAAQDMGHDASSAATRTLRTHPYISAAALLGALIALTGITLLASRSATR